MDETPEELEQIRRDAERIDVHQYRNRFRVLRAIAVGAALAGLTWLILIMLDSGRNPCERVRDHFCKSDPAGVQCQTYKVVWHESVEEGSQMRAHIRAQCQSKIDRLGEEDGVRVR
jgi:hypothetical protein